MKKVLLIFFLSFLPAFAGDLIAKEEERKLELLKKEKDRGLLCPLVFGKDAFIPRKKLTILRKLGREIRYYVVLPGGKVVPLSSCEVVEVVESGS